MSKDIQSREVHTEQEIRNCCCLGRLQNSITGLEWIIESTIIIGNAAGVISDISVIVVIIISIGTITRAKAKEIIATEVDVAVDITDGNQVEK